MPVTALLLDVDGVLVVSWEPVPGAIDAMDAIRAAGIPVRFLTNTTSRTRAAIGTRLRDLGFALDDSELLTASVATGAYLAQHHAGARCLVLDDGPLDDLGDITLVRGDEQPDVVVIGSAGPSFTWDAINRVVRAVIGGAALVAMHGTTVWQTAEGLCVDGGAYVATIERATGRRAVTIGKPAPAMFDEALRGLGVTAADATMVGDDIDTDVLAAQAVGIRGVLVRSGKHRAGSLDTSPRRPDAVLDSLAALPAWLGLT